MPRKGFSPDEVFLLHPGHASFLTDGVRRLQDGISLSALLQLWVIVTLTFLPSGVIVYTVYYFVFYRLLRFTAGPDMALFLAVAVMMLGGLWVALGRRRQEKKLEVGGIEIPGTISGCELARSLSLTGFKPVLRISYTFVSLRGTQVHNTQLVSLRQLRPEDAPPPGTPVAVLYYDEKLNRIL